MSDYYRVTEYDEYGQMMRGMRGRQLIRLLGHPGLYAVDYVIENMSNIGDIEIVAVYQLVDRFGMGSWSLVPVRDHRTAAAAMEMRAILARAKEGV